MAVPGLASLKKVEPSHFGQELSARIRLMAWEDSFVWMVKNVHADHGGFAISHVLREAKELEDAARLAAARADPDIDAGRDEEGLTAQSR
jgi:hypothetical protein